MRLIVLAVIALLGAMLGTVQLGSMMMPRPVGLAIYHLLDRVAPLPFVEETLGAQALAAGDFDRAEHYALRTGPSPRRDDLLGEIAQARGNMTLAGEYYFAAPDVDRMETIIGALGKSNPRKALDVDLRFAQRLEVLQTHPDALADAWFTAGVYSEALKHRAASLGYYERALHLGPLNMRYLLGAGTQALNARDYVEAQRIFQHGLDVDPASGDVYAGLGIVALHQGDRTRAKVFAVRARALQPKSPMLAALMREMR